MRWSSRSAHWAHNPEVVGSSPTLATKNKLTKMKTQITHRMIGTIGCQETTKGSVHLEYDGI